MLRIQEVAQRVGCHPDTLRAWERRGLVRPRRDRNGARRYTEEEILRLRALLFPESNASDPDRNGDG